MASRHDRSAWLRRAERLLERGLDVLEKRIADEEDPITVAELVRALEGIASRVTTQRAVVVEGEADDEQPRARGRRKRSAD